MKHKTKSCDARKNRTSRKSVMQPTDRYKRKKK